jgi:membrane-associated PAP2 superfamily phosphatase
MNRPRFDTRFWLAHALLPLALFVLLAALFELTDLDLLLSDPWYDRAAGAWTFKRSWWAEGVIHRGGRSLVAAIAFGSLAVWGLSFRLVRLRSWRRAALFLALAIGLGTGGVALAKQLTNRHCPWEYDRYGGKIPYVRLFGATPSGCPKGDCFPAGHASGAFSLMGSYFIFYGRRRLARGGLAIGMGLGALFGFGQLARGAHFFSHNLWSAAVCWFAALLLYVLAFGGRLLPETGWAGGSRRPIEATDRSPGACEL